MEKVKTAVIICVIRHRQNHLESTDFRDFKVHALLTLLRSHVVILRILNYDTGAILQIDSDSQKHILKRYLQEMQINA
jgi:hypothetical protein